MGWAKSQRTAAHSAQPQASRPAVAPAPALLDDLDTQLMLQVQAGDREAFNQLIRRNFDRVARFIGRLVRDPRMVEDLTQDVFLKVFERAADYQPSARLSTWLYRIATNTALNHLKSAAERRAAGEPGGELPDHRSAGGPDGRLGAMELQRQVSAAVEALPPNQRVAVTLFEYEELSYEQISAILGVSVEGVRALLSRARITLRSSLHGLL